MRDDDPVDEDTTSKELPAHEGVVALAPHTPEGTLTRSMTVDLGPAEVVATLLGLGAMVPRSVGEESRFERHPHDGRIFYERTSEGLVLWCRPHPNLVGRRGAFEAVPYPDMVEARIEGVPRGSRIELRWRPHPLTRVATRWTVGGVVVSVVGIAVMIALGLLANAVPAAVVFLVALAILTRRHWRLSRDRRALEPLLRRAHEALAPHELGGVEIEGSAFRVSAGSDSVGLRRR